MTTKTYLSQARYLDMRIKSKLQQVDSLNELATTCTSVLTGMPRNPSGSISRMADAVCAMLSIGGTIVFFKVLLSILESLCLFFQLPSLSP